MRRNKASAVTIRDVAQVCGVGVATVSRAFNDSPDISQATRQRILAAASRLNYSPNPNAQSLRAEASSSIAVLMKGPDNPFFFSILQLLEREISVRGYSMMLVRVPHGADEVALAARTCAVSKPSGIIFLGGWYRHDKAALDMLPVPFVLCTFRSLDDSDSAAYSSVCIDDAGAMEMIAQHLLDLGHTKFAVLGPDLADRSVGMIRLSGLIAAFKDRGVYLDPELILNGEVALSPYSFRYGYELAKRLIKRVQRGGEFTALITMSDVLAIGAQRALVESGIKVPSDVSVTGFDGIELSRYTSPSLTTIVQPVEEIASKTCDIVFGLLEGGVSARHELIAPTLRIAESTAPVRRDEVVVDAEPERQA